MEFMPAAFHALNLYKQFVVYHIRPSTSRPGKSDKIPVNLNTGLPANAHDPAIWLSGDEAMAAANRMGARHGVGFVFTDNDPFWFLDIDSCVVNGKWSPLAVELLTRLVGCAVEVSQSGQGLHIIGSGILPEHCCKPAELNIELYNSGRFVALTGNNAVGNAAFTSDAIWEIANQYFPPRSNSNGNGDILQRFATLVTRGVDSRWVGSVDDSDLIRRACLPHRNTFSSKATFRDLWQRNVHILAGAYPAPDKLDGYDDSKADAALAQHLAFWTGCDAERMRTLMLASGLYRDKYDRGDYLPRTIVNAIEINTTVCIDPPPVAPVMVASIDTSSAFLNAEQQAAYFAGCVYVIEQDKMLVPRGRLLKPTVFKSAYGGKIFTIDAANSRTTKNAFDAFIDSQLVVHPQVDDTCFRPDLPTGAIINQNGFTYVNTYWPMEIPCVEGDVTLFLEHLIKLCPVKRDADILLSYMAAVVQYQGVKFQWCPFIQGVEGNGKTLLTKCVQYAVGSAYTHFPKAAELASRFNDFMYERVFIAVEDIYVADGLNEIYEALKPMITGEWQEIEPKGGKKVTRQVCANFIINSNHKDGLRKTRNNRTFAPFYTAQQSLEDLKRDGMSGGYFERLYGWLNDGGFANVNHFLRNYHILDEYNPAGSCRRVPTTSCTESAITQSAGRIEQEVIEAIASGRPGFRNGWVSTTALNNLLDEIRATARIARNKRGELLRSLGYELHRGLLEGRTTSNVIPDGNRPCLYVRSDHLTLLWDDGQRITKQYEKDQV